MQVRGVYQRFPPPPQRVPYETRGLEVTKPALGVILGRVFVVSSGFWVVLRFAVGKLRLCMQPGAFSFIFGMHEWPVRLCLRASRVSGVVYFCAKGFRRRVARLLLLGQLLLGEERGVRLRWWRRRHRQRRR